MAGVASGDSTSAIAETILGMNRFAAGVPADDATCNAIIGMLKGLSDGDYDSPFRSATVATWQGNDGPPCRGGQDVPFAVSEDHFVEIGFYTKEEGPGELVAFFRAKAQHESCNQYHTKPATPEGLQDGERPARARSVPAMPRPRDRIPPLACGGLLPPLLPRCRHRL